MDTFTHKESHSMGGSGSLSSSGLGCGGQKIPLINKPSVAACKEKIVLLDSRDPGSMLVLRAGPHKTERRRRRLAKLVKVGADPGEVESYEGDFLFEARGYDVSTFDKLLNVIVDLQDKPACAAVSGARVDEKANCIRRNMIDQPDKFNPKKIWKAAIVDKPSYWLAMDIDDALTMPSHVRGLMNGAVYVRAQMRACFRGARCIVTATGTYEINRGPHMRFWFLLDKPLTCVEKRQWLGPVKWIDPALYSANQLVYTAAPRFEDACNDDPLFGMSRVVELDGAECVVTPSVGALKPAPRPVFKPPPGALNGENTGFGMSTLGSALFLIYNAPNKPERSRHEWIRIACHAVAFPISIGLLDRDTALEQLIAASVSIGGAEQRDWARETSNLLDWALRVEAEEDAREGGSHE